MCEDTWTLIQQSTVPGKYHRKTSYLLGNIDVGIWEFTGMGYHVNDMQMMQNQVAVDDVTWKSHKMIAQINCTNKSHKRIAQNDCGRQDDITSKNGNDEQCFWMLQSNSDSYGGPETG